MSSLMLAMMVNAIGAKAGEKPQADDARTAERDTSVAVDPERTPPGWVCSTSAPACPVGATQPWDGD